MNRKGAFIAGLLLAVTLTALAAQSGFPSRPRFQSVGVNAAPPATAGHVTATQFNGSAAGLTNLPDAALSANVPRLNAANAYTATQSVTGGVNASDNLHAGGALIAKGYTPGVIGPGPGVEIGYTAGEGFLQSYDRTATVLRPLNLYGSSVGINTGGATVAICLQDGTNCPSVSVPKVAQGKFNGNGTCAVSAGASGITSCSRSGNGTYDVNITAAGFTASPSCTVNVVNSGAASALVRGLVETVITTTTVPVLTLNNAAAATDYDFTLVCVGT